jgi:hypothetical protein
MRAYDSMVRKYTESQAALANCEAERATLEGQVNALLNHCPDAECDTCATIICPHKDRMHFHHDGCPSCAQIDDTPITT